MAVANQNVLSGTGIAIDDDLPDQQASSATGTGLATPGIDSVIQPAILPVLQQLLNVSAGQDSVLLQDFIQRLAGQRRVWNALHDLAEVIYDVGSYQLTEQESLLKDTRLLQVLQRGRVALYPADSTATASALTETDTAPCDNLPACSDTPLDPQALHNSDDSAEENAQDKKMPYFQIPNARAGQPYQGQVRTQGSDAQLVLLNAETVILPEDIGIAYNAGENCFEGIPTRAGEFEFRFQYRLAQPKDAQKDQQWLDAACAFIVTADPRSLWQVKEPSPDEPYQKPHQQQQLIKGQNFQVAAVSRRGRSHEHAGSFRDDEVHVQQVGDTDWSILLVADGAGSAPFSREGSRLAVQEAATILAQYIEQQHVQLDAQLAGWQIGAQDQASSAIANGLYKEFHDLFYKVMQQAITRIDQEATHRAVASKAFATTLLAAVVRQTDSSTFVSSFWVGDGAIAVYSPQKMRLMGTPDAGEFAGQTRFLDKSIAQQFSQRVNIGYYDNIHAVILLTDGVSDPRFETDAGLASQQKWDALWQEWQPSLSNPQPDTALLEWMHFFQPGHHDDRSLAVLWRPELIHAAETEEGN